jgi:hypothetical protein
VKRLTAQASEPALNSSEQQSLKRKTPEVRFRRWGRTDALANANPDRRYGHLDGHSGDSGRRLKAAAGPSGPWGTAVVRFRPAAQRQNEGLSSINKKWS